MRHWIGVSGASTTGFIKCDTEVGEGFLAEVVTVKTKLPDAKEFDPIRLEPVCSISQALDEELEHQLP